MTRVLIPRSDNTSAKIVEASDFEKYHSFLNDHIISGFVVSAGSGLDVDVGTGTGRLQGVYVENTGTCNVSGLTAWSTNYLYISIDRDPNCEPEGWSVVTNKTNTTPVCSIKIASIVTGASTVSSVSQVQDSGDGSGDITYNSEKPKLTVAKAKEVYSDIFWLRDQIEEALTESLDFTKA